MSYSMDSQWEKQLDHYLTTPPKEKDTHFWCSDCGKGFYPGDKYYEVDDGTYLCRDCAMDWLDNRIETATEEDCYPYGEDGDY